jgi:hypothetical protein
MIFITFQYFMETIPFNKIYRWYLEKIMEKCNSFAPISLGVYSQKYGKTVICTQSGRDI